MLKLKPGSKERKISDWEKSRCQSMKGLCPRDCLVGVCLHLLAERSDHVTSVCSVRAGLGGISFLLFLDLIVILCLNIYPQFIDTDVIRVGLY